MKSQIVVIMQLKERGMNETSIDNINNMGFK